MALTNKAEWDYGQYVGMPYEGKFGCFQLVRKVLEDQGVYPNIGDPTTSLEYDQRTEELHSRLLQHTTAVEWDDRQPGDIALLNIFGRPGHIGIYIGNNQMLHCLEGTNAVIEAIDGIRWINRIACFWRVNEGS